MPQARLQIKLTPRASRDRLVGREGDCLKVSLSAPPVDGQANQSLIKFLAKNLKISPSSVNLIQGTTSRHKLVQIDGLNLEDIWKRLNIP
ncbi:MAG: DUF167 domain-containing protein [Deltaproteobacteria bacterium]|jgi:uncharacterized protein (TIGR00251 family)|nr:DUF167 domain-containing protein [Deltaproteobacteria bacterium]